MEKGLPNTVWLSFIGCQNASPKCRQAVLQFQSCKRKELSDVVALDTSGKFSSSIDCVLPADKNSSFALHLFSGRSYSSRKDESETEANTQSMISFSFDSESLRKELASRPDDIVLDRDVSLPGKLQLLFKAALKEPQNVESDDISVISSYLIPESNTKDADASFSSLSEEDFSMDEKNGRSPPGSPQISFSSSRKMKVRFNNKIHTIPSTQQLEKEMQIALEERSRLSRSVGDMSVQLVQLKQEMKDLKERLHQVAEPTSLRATAANTSKPKDASGFRKRRRVVLDGDALVSMYHHKQNVLNGIEIALDYYLLQGVSAVAVVSEYILSLTKAESKKHGDVSYEARRSRLIETALLFVTSSRSKQGHFIVKYAADQNAEIVSNETFQSVTGKSAVESNQRMLQAFVDSQRISFMFIAKKFVPSRSSSSQSNVPAALPEDGRIVRCNSL